MDSESDKSKMIKLDGKKRKLNHLKFLKELYLYLSAGFKIEPSLKKIRGGEEIGEYIKRGLDLSTALKLEGFPEFIVQNIKIGEETGKLTQILENLVSLLELKENLERDIKFALITPLFSIASLFVFFSIVVVFVIPEILLMLSEFGVQPPKSIILIQNVREYIQDNFITFTAIFLGFAYIIISQIREIPLFNSAKLSICTRALAICLDNGIPLQKALILTSYLIPGKIKKEMELEVGRILRGLIPSFSFIKEFQEELLSSFERGRLSQVLFSISDIYLDRAKREAEIIKRAIEPTLFIITSIFLIFFIVSIYLPIIEKIREMM